MFMKIISNIKRNKKLFQVELNSGEELLLLEQTVTEFNLYKNKELSDQYLKEIQEYNQVEDYFLLATKLVNKGTRNKDKLVEHLSKNGAKKSQIKMVMDKLQKFGYFDEEKLIKEVVANCNAKYLGVNKIKSTLISKGIAEEKVSKLKFNNLVEFSKAEIQSKKLIKKYKKECFESLKRKTYLGLIQKGFDDSVSKECVEKFCKFDKKHELNMLKLDYAKYFSSYSRKYKGNELKQKIVNRLLSKGYKINDINLIKENKK